jgi:hypothetical protein
MRVYVVGMRPTDRPGPAHLQVQLLMSAGTRTLKARDGIYDIPSDILLGDMECNRRGIRNYMKSSVPGTWPNVVRYVGRQFRGTYRLHHQSDENGRARNNVSNNYQPKHKKSAS